MPAQPQVSGLYVYPVKSCAGTALREARIGPRGVEHDREFMLVGADHRFVTQRELPRLALVRPRVQDACVTLDAPGLSRLQLAPTERGQRYEVVVWRDRVVAVDQGDMAADWFSSYLHTHVRLVRIPAEVMRPVDPAYARRSTDQVGFADGYPLLLISEESLDDLNARLAVPLAMDRFRPNVVVRGCRESYAEDTWAEIRIGTLHCEVVKACARCAITTTDQATAERGAEPLATLATYRRVPRGVLFGQNLIHTGEGTVSIGDPVSVLRRSMSPE